MVVKEKQERGVTNWEKGGRKVSEEDEDCEGRKLRVEDREIPTNKRQEGEGSST